MSAVQEAPAAVRSRGTSARRDRFLARRLGLITFALAISGSTTLLFNVVLARKLSPTEFGDIARTFALALTVGQLTMTGVAPAVARIVAQAEDDAGRFARARAGIWTLALFTFVVSLLFFPLALAGLAPTDPLQLALGWGVAFVYAFYFGLKMLLFVLDRAREYALFEGASDVIFFVVLGASAVLAPRYGLASFSVAYGIFVVGVIAYIVRRAKTRERIVLGRAFAKHAFLTAVSTYGSVARFPLVVSIAGLVGTRHDAAEMAVIFSLVMPLYLLPRAAGFMTFANVARRAEGAAEDVCRTVRAVSLVGAFGIFVGVLFAHPLIQLVLGARYLEAATALMIVAVCLTPAMASVPIANAGSADGRVADKAAISAFGLAVAAVGAYLLTPSHHAVGAALAVGGSMVITGGLSLVRAHFHYRLRFADIAGATVLFLCSAAAVVVQPGLALSIVVLGLSLCAIFSYARKTLALPLSVNRPEFLIAPVAGLVILCLGAAVVVSPYLAFVFLVAIAMLFIIPRIRPRHLAAIMLAYLPFEAFLLTYVPGPLVVPMRYGPELLIDATLAFLVVTHAREVGWHMRRFWIPLVLLVTVWVLPVIWNAVGPSTALIGFRAELRFLPLMFLPLLSRNLDRDIRVFGRILVFTAAVESLIVVAQFFGGPAVRAIFAPNWNIVLSGLSLASSGASRLDRVFGTFTNHNAVAAFLLYAWIALAAAGGERLGLSRRRSVYLGTFIAIAIFLTGSREATAGLVLAAVVVGHVRFRRPIMPMAAAALAAAALSAPFWAPTGGGAPGSPSALTARWAQIFHPSTWSTSTSNTSNFRLALLASNAALVAQSHPLVGFGLGTVSDVRKINDGSSPLLKTHAGQVALRRSFFYDGNWSLLIVEVGFLGIAAVGLLFASLARLGRWLSETHWIGTALLANVVVTFWLGFFAPIMQARVPSLVLWLSAGLAIALARGRWNPKDERARVPAAQGAGSSAWIAAPELSTKLAPSPVSVGVMRKSSW